MIKFFTRTNSPDPLTTKLREQAQAFDPVPPRALHGRIMSALAQADAGPRPASSRASWIFAAGTIVAAAIVAVVVLRDRPHPVKVVRNPNRAPVNVDAHSYPNPLALALQYVDDPLQNEVQNLLSDLSRASTTVTHVFPGASKRQQKPATQGRIGATGV